MLSKTFSKFSDSQTLEMMNLSLRSVLRLVANFPGYST